MRQFLVKILIIAAVAACSNARGPSVTLTPSDTIALSDVTTRSRDTSAERAYTEAARLALGESPFLTLAAPGATHGTLRITGSVADRSAPVSVDLQALSWATGDTVAIGHAEVTPAGTTIEALGRAASALRLALGEPPDTVRKYSTPLARATTVSLEALESWALGMAALRSNGAVASVPFFARATALDSAFVRATFDLGLAYRNSGQESLARQAWTRAFALRRRADTYTAFSVAGGYYSFVTADSGQAVNTYHAWSSSYPRDYRAVSNLGSFYGDISLFDQAIAQFAAASRMNPNNVIIRENLIELLTATGAFARAAAEYDTIQRRHLDDDAPHVNMYAVRFLTHDSAGMAREVAWFEDKPNLRHEILSEEADAAAYDSHLRGARALSQEAILSAERAGNTEQAAAWALNAAWREEVFGFAGNARELALRALALAPESREGAAIAAIVLARTGDTARARAVFQDLDHRYADHAVEQAYWLPCIRAQIALTAGNPRAALDYLRTAERYDLMIPQVAYYSLMPSVVLRAEVYAALGQSEAAANEWSIVARHPGIVQMSATARMASRQMARLRRHVQ